MRLRKLAFLPLLAVLVSTLAYGQEKAVTTDDEKEKKQKELDKRVVEMLDQAVAEGELLRLAQNRAIVYAIAGDLYWKYDEKRARQLFRNAATELTTYNQETERDRRDSSDPYIDLYNWGDPRTDILPLVAKHDAELALEMLVQTRSAKLNEALLRASVAAPKQSNLMEWNPDNERVRQEVALEQQFALLAADENPEKAIKLIKDSLTKGVSPNVLALLQKLNKKDEKKAAALAGDVIKKLLDAELDKKMEDMQAALYFLQTAFKPETGRDPKEKQFSFTEAQMKDLATKLANTLLDSPRSLTTASLLLRAAQLIEKFAPGKGVMVRQRISELEASLPPEYKRMQEQQKLWDANSTPEDLIAHLPKLQNEYEKAQAYSQLAGKIAEIDDEARAKKLIGQIPDEKARANIQEQFEAARINRSANAGKLDDAMKMIGNLTKKRLQIQRLVSIAVEFHKKGGEKEIETANKLMKDARALTAEFPETNDDINDVMEVVKGYATVDPAMAFRMFEPVIDQMNDYVQASSVLARFNAQSSSFKKGELVMKAKSEGMWDIPLFRFIPQMQALGKADLERMSTAADRFARSDSRVIVRLFVLQGFLSDGKKQETAPTASSVYYY